MINEDNFDRDLRLELSRARYDICDNIMSSRPIFVERGGQESLLFLTGLARTCEYLRESKNRQNRAGGNRKGSRSVMTK